MIQRRLNLYRYCAYGQHIMAHGVTYYVINPEGGYNRPEILCCFTCIKKPENSAALERMIETGGASELTKYRIIQMNDVAATTDTPTTPAKKSEPRLYKVKDRVTGDVIYVNANSRSQTENFASYRRWDITILTVKEALGLKPEDILDATAQPGPPAQVKLDAPAA